MKKCKDYFEPWTAARSKVWEPSFRGGPPPVDDAGVLDRWHADRDRAESHADWIVWGSGMVPPHACSAPLGGTVVMDDRHVVVAVRRPVTQGRDAAPDQESISRRIVACVNACRGMIDPQGAIDDTRALLVDLASGRATADDPRVLRCAARLAGPRADGPTEEQPWS